MCTYINKSHMGDYGFYDESSLPLGKYKDVIIKDADRIDWLTTYDVNTFAKNHCGAVAATNISLYYASRGFRDLNISNDKIEVFKKLHALIGNGPVVTIAGGLDKYFSSLRYDLRFSNLGNLESIKNALVNDRIIGILLAKDLFNWHWVLGLGYREYEDGSVYIRILNGWDNAIDKFYMIHSGSLWISATQYWLLF